VTSPAESEEPAVISAGRITVTVIARTAQELSTRSSAEGCSKSDVVNRAISLYAFVMEQLDAGHELALRDRVTGELRIVKLL
jgi:hypothetical protein